MPRRFSGSQRTALYLAADGKCSLCGAQLEPGWHSDHVAPFSRGGETDVINGQALCPPCNLRKGSSVSELREWQEECLDKFTRTEGDFLLVATPGAGKTTFALAAAQQMIKTGEADHLIVVVPTSHLRSQWKNAAARMGVQLDDTFANGSSVVARDYNGIVVTYSALAFAPLLYRKLASQKRTLVVLDEVHHGGDALAWGAALREAFDGAARRLLLSGTPARTDGTPIPFVNYDNERRFISDYSYDYGRALQDQAVVRPIEFLALDGAVSWREAGHVVSVDLAGATDDDLKNSLAAALNPDGEWIGSVLRQADAELTRHRSEVPDAGGLVVAADQYLARRYAHLLARMTGEEAAVAISDDPAASEKIAEFTKSSRRWLVAVQMVSEGVDIPRLSVGVYASKYRTDLFFRQVVGRFVRTRGAADEQTASLFIPSIEPLLRYAQAIERTVDRALTEKEERLRDAKDELPAQIRLDLVEPLDSSEATHHSTIRSGEQFADAELRRAEEVLRDYAAPPSVTPAWMAGVLRGVTGRFVGTATVAATVVRPSERPLVDQKATLRQMLQRKVGRIHRLTGLPHGQVNAELNKACGREPVGEADLDSLNRRLKLADDWINRL